MGFYYELFPCFKSLLKELFGFKTLNYDKISDVLLTIVTVFLVIILFVVLLPWIILNYILRGYLILVHGSNYGGLLEMEMDVGKTLDYNDLDSNENNGRRIAVFVEGDQKYFDIIKQLKTHFKVTFTDVIATAAISSLTDYLNEKGVAPESILYGNTARALTENPAAILNGDILRNESTLHIAEIPCKTGDSESLTCQLRTVSKVLCKIRNSADSQCLYLLQKVCSFLPPAVLGSLIGRCTEGASLGITNIPAPNFGSIGSHPIQDILMFPSKFGKTKFVMTIFSYGGRLQVILSSRNGLVTTREDLERILDRTFKNIEAILEENKDTTRN